MRLLSIAMLGTSMLAIATIGANIVTSQANAGHATTAKAMASEHFVDAEGNIHLARINYRLDWEMLGTWSVDADSDGKLDELHWVYASPGTVDYFRKHKTFADGTVLIKDLHSVEMHKLKTGDANNSTGPFATFVMVRDTSGAHKDHANWHDGWGWGLFEAGENDKNVMPLSKCLECHEPVKDKDWVYSFGYPIFNEPAE